MISPGGRHHQLIDGLRAGMAAKRAVLDKTVAGYQESARAIVARPAAQDQAQDTQEDQRARQNREHHDAGDYDAVDSWMSDQRRGAPDPEPEDTRPSPHDAVLDRIDRGELSWGDVLSGRVDDPGAAAVRTFLADRAADVRLAREARA
jgi:hypothetical protein